MIEEVEMKPKTNRRAGLFKRRNSNVERKLELKKLKKIVEFILDEEEMENEKIHIVLKLQRKYQEETKPKALEAKLDF